ncbi:SRPBCC family protein [Nocardioides jejuensis]|uniref:Polyketide cyclase n=1 Tax=Nocardioides jejuensis TaxID=2502782 RepID=A0A4R1BUG1_9ACTN|nr:SRPBCC family protein [Nocardioides jejuensis]TCJ21524.1 polyketide cyclase [Nocardioides jejuensis]
MNRSTRHETAIVADPDIPVITIVREFDASPSDVFRAHVDPDIFRQWCGPRSTEMRIEHWDARTGGAWRYAAWRQGEEIARFFGSFHEVREPDRIVQTFTYEGGGDGVSLETLRLEELPGGRTRLTGVSVVDTMELRDIIMNSGMEVGVVEGYERLDALLA